MTRNPWFLFVLAFALSFAGICTIGDVRIFAGVMLSIWAANVTDMAIQRWRGMRVREQVDAFEADIKRDPVVRRN